MLVQECARPRLPFVGVQSAVLGEEQMVMWSRLPANPARITHFFLASPPLPALFFLLMSNGQELIVVGFLFCSQGYFSDAGVFYKVGLENILYLSFDWLLGFDVQKKR